MTVVGNSLRRLPRVTQAWACPYFETLFMLSFATIATGLVSETSVGSGIAVAAALFIGGQLGTRKHKRDLTGHSC